MLMFVLLRRTGWLGEEGVLSPDIKRRLWLRGGLSLAAYVAVFNLALRFTAASHVALYLAASPVWALMWEDKTGATRGGLLKRYSAAALALFGVAVLFLPVLKAPVAGAFPGELLGLAASVLWTNYGRQCRALGSVLSGASLSAHTMWRAGILLLPLALLELGGRRINLWEPKNLLVQLYCILGGGVVAFALWNHGLRHWKTSEVYLFNNLIPVSTMLWAHFCLAEPVTGTFWLAMALILAGVVIGQAKWERILGRFWLPAE
jgi:drug/metabolite transporter (DMT)-like permease